MSWKFGERSERELRTVEDPLQRVCRRALELSPVDFGILQGLRTAKEQADNVARGASQTLHSRHLTGKAIDYGVYVRGKYVNGDTEDEYELYYQVALAFKQAAKELGIAIVWGGDWKTLKDGGHIELDRKVYP
ncbi:M15 family metallopeptidase [Methylobacterium sp. 1030]|uniref:M15 family metallopeptidase n=1 Tax=Methylobacterium sp. 1030 TaxID=3156404 RepID=UPI003392A9D4